VRRDRDENRFEEMYSSGGFWLLDDRAEAAASPDDDVQGRVSMGMIDKPIIDGKNV
jgi:hypothetical protein